MREARRAGICPASKATAPGSDIILARTVPPPFAHRTYTCSASRPHRLRAKMAPNREDMSELLGLGLKQALESGDCVLFIGIGCHLVDPEGKPAPDGETLAKELAAHFGLEVGEHPDLAKVAQVIEIRKK